MRTRRHLGIAITVVPLLAGAGCSLYKPRPVTFHVRDGDTGQPVAGARVETFHWAFMDFGHWFSSVGPSEGTTDHDGNLTLFVDPSKSNFKLRVTADDYPEFKDEDGLTKAYGGSPRWERWTAGPWYALRDEYEVRLFRGSPPTAVITLPDGYRGVVLVRLSAGEPRSMGGQRKITCTATPRGEATISDGDFFRAVGFFDGVQARYESGHHFPTYVPNRHLPIPPTAPADDTLALRFVTPVWEQSIWLYVLGTAADAQAVERSVWPDLNHFDQAAFDRIVEEHSVSSQPAAGITPPSPTASHTPPTR